MFIEEIGNTSFNDNLSNMYFEKKIFGDKLSYDDSFLSSLRAFLSSRIGENDTVHLRTMAITNPSSADLCFDKIYTQVGTPGSNEFFIVRNLNKEIIENISSDYEEYLNNRTYIGSYKKIQKITEFYKKNFDVVCFVNNEAKTTLMFTGRLDLPRWHYLQYSILPSMPYYFDPKNGDKILDEERELIDSLGQKDFEKYLNALEKIAKKIGFKEKIMSEMLDGFEAGAERIELIKLEQKIKNEEEDIQSLKERIASALTELRRNIAFASGLRASIEDGSSKNSIRKYIENNKNIVIDKVCNDEIVFSVKTYLSQWDDDEFEGYYNNPSSGFYRDKNIPDEDFKLLLKSVFMDRKIKIRVCAKFSMGLTSVAYAISEEKYNNNFEGYMPNPHIQHHSCMGDYENIVSQIACTYNYTGVMDACIASTKAINFADYTVISEFISILKTGNAGGYHASDYTTNRCFELPDGSITDTIGAIEYIKKDGESNGKDDKTV